MREKDRSSDHEEQRLRGSTAWQKKPAGLPVPIGEIIEPFLSKRNPQYERSEALAGAWDSIVPESMRSHCRLAGFGSGILTVEAAAGPFLHQLQMIRSRVLDEIKTMCPRCGLRDIRILPGSFRQEKAEI